MFKLWHQGYRQAREDRSGLAEWNTRHAHVVREAADQFEQRGDNVFLEMQNWFETHSTDRRQARHHRATAGRQRTVYDVKTGEPRPSDEIQVKLYMLLLPWSNHGRWQRATPDGCVLYGNGAEVPISADSVDDEFRQQAAAVMRRIVADEPARKVPSSGECAWCVVSSADCPERVESTDEQAAG